MRIGTLTLAEAGATDAAVARIAALLSARGLLVSGVVQSNSDRTGDAACDMDLTVLRGGGRYRISQSLGAGSSGCRLNPAALEAAVADLSSRVEGAQVLVLNKFGVHEAAGRGFRGVIAEALGQGVPVLIGVASKNRAAFDAFAGDLADAVEEDGVPDWLAGLRALA